MYLNMDTSTCLPCLDDYHRSQPTKSCYLDGRYFNHVFKKYPGLAKEPLVIRVTPSGVVVTGPTIKCTTRYNTILRVVIETPSARHDTVAILDHQTRLAYWFDPFDSSFDQIITDAITQATGYHVFRLHDRAPAVMTPTCDASGFCTAYSIKYIYDYLKNQPCDLTDIKSFASRVEKEYPILTGDKDVCYGWLDGPGGGALIGGLGGAAIGGLTGGIGGAALLGGVGALGGYGLSGGFR